MPMNERCGDCGRPADYRCEERTLGPKVKVPLKDGGYKIVEPYEVTFRCSDCTKQAVAGACPPRQVGALPHHEHVLKTNGATETVEAAALGDWGRRR